jgi:suppressor of ftsI
MPFFKMKMKCDLSLLLMSMSAAVFSFDQTLPQVPSVFSENGVLDTTLYVDVCEWTGPVSFRTRCFNWSVPGPTLYIYPGDIVRIQVINNLGEEDEDYEDENTFHTPNTTSLHTHGLHVSPSPPGDNVFLNVGSHESLEYVYDIPSNHYPGTHLYHPHSHGSASIQVYGGMIGNIIVLPKDDFKLPSIVKDITWDNVMLNHVWMEYSNDDDSAGYKSMLDVIYWSGDQLPFQLRYDPEYNNSADEFQYGYPTVNGEFRPTYSIQKGHWQGLRMTNGGIHFNLELEMAEDSDCEWYIVARDGVYLDEPLQENCIFLPPAARMDVVFRCHTVGTTWMWNNASNSDREFLFETFDGAYVHRMMTAKVLEFNVIEAEEEQSHEISPSSYFLPQRPYYLRSLVDVPESDLNGTMDIYATSYGSPGYNFLYYTSIDDIFYTMYLDKVYEFSFTSETDGVHPTHIHVNHMQIVNDVVLGDEQSDKSFFSNNPAYRVGEWRDTIYVMSGRGLSVRFRTDTFTGKIPMHCHYFMHSDKGMFVVMEILNQHMDLDEESGLDSNE